MAEVDPSLNAPNLLERQRDKVIADNWDKYYSSPQLLVEVFHFCRAKGIKADGDN